MTTTDTILESSTQAAPPSVLARLRTLTTGKRRTAREVHWKFVRKAAAGYQPNDRELFEWHDASERAGFDDDATQSHILLHQKLAEAEALHATQPAALRKADTDQARLEAIDAEIAEIGTKRAHAERSWRESLLALSVANSAEANADSLRQQIAALTSE